MIIGEKVFETVTALCIFCFASVLAPLAQTTPEQEKIISVERIWDRAGHNAFTDLAHWNGVWYSVFRESATHKPDQNENCMVNGGIRMIASVDGQNWASVAHLYEKDADLRDPKLSVTPDHRLMLLFGSSAYGVVYQAAGQRWDTTQIHLVQSTDGITYEHVSSLEVSTGPNEADVQFLADGQMVVIVRGTPGAIGVSSPPFTKWKWNPLPVYLGGPELMVLQNDSLLCATRESSRGNAHRTILAKVSLSGDFRKVLTLPSGGDTGYAGMVLKDEVLYISYYSSHESQISLYNANREKGIGKSCIYLAKVWADRLN